MRLFAQLSWYFRREWRRYLGAIALLVIIAVLQLIPPKVVGIVVDGVTQQHYTAGNDSNLLIVFYVQIVPDDFVMQLHRF